MGKKDLIRKIRGTLRLKYLLSALAALLVSTTSLVLVTSTFAGASTTWNVSTSGTVGLGCNPCQLAYAIANASTGDTISLAGGTTYTSANSGGFPITISTGASITIQAVLGAKVALDGGGSSEIFSITSGTNVTLKSLTFQNGMCASGCPTHLGGNSGGGAISTGGSLTVENSTFVNNSEGSGPNWGGGAIFENRGNVTISNSTFYNNTTGSTGYLGGALRQIGGSMTVSGTTFSSNTGGSAADIANTGGTAYLLGSIATDTCTGITDDGYNAVPISNGCVSGATGDVTSSSVSSDLGSLAYNLSGTTDTLAPSTGNLAIGAIPSSTSVTVGGSPIQLCPQIDQNGTSSGSTACTSGAVYEVPPLPNLPVPTVSTTTTVSNSSNLIPQGAPLTLTATVNSDQKGSVQGTVSFYNSDTPIEGCSNQPILPTSSSATCVVSFTSTGSIVLSAVYNGSGVWLKSTSSPDQIEVVQAPVATQTTVTPNSSTSISVGATISFTSTVSSQYGTPTGEVTFYNQSGPVLNCISIPLVLGTASCTAEFSSTGQQSIYATYLGDSAYNSSSSNSVEVLVGDILYASTNGNSTATSCPFSQPCTLANALALIVNGGIIYLEAGDYNRGNIGQAGLPLIVNSSTDETLTIRPVPGAMVELDGSPVGYANYPQLDSFFDIGQHITLSLSNLSMINSDAQSGGAIDNSGTLDISDVTFDNNSSGSFSAPGNGAAIFNSGTLSVVDSTFASNSALGGGDGGGLYNAGTATLISSTVYTNSATSGNGIYNSGTLYVAGSYLGDDCGGNGIFDDFGYNVIVADALSSSSSRASCGTASNDVILTNQVGLTALAFNGGTTETFLPTNQTAGLDPALGLIPNNTEVSLNGDSTPLCPEIDERGASSNGGPCTPGAVVSSANATVPDAPVALNGYPGDGSATLTWNPPYSNGGDPITSYEIFQGSKPGDESYISPVATTLDTSTTITGLSGGQTYYFTVEAVNEIGNSVASAETSIMPSLPTQTQIDPLLGALTPGTPLEIVVSVTTTIGSPTGTATILSNGTPLSNCSNLTVVAGEVICQVTYSSVGTYLLSASFSGIGQYNSSSSAAVSVIVGTTLYVAPTPMGMGDLCTTSTPCSLDQALSEVSGTTTIEMNTGDYSNATVGTLGLPITITPGIQVTLQAYPGQIVVLDGKSDYQVVTVANDGNLTLSGVTVENGFSKSNGGAIDNSGTLDIEDSTVAYNNAQGNFGGGLYNSGTAYISESTFAQNNAAHGGGIFNTGTLTVIGSTIDANTGSSNSGVVNASVFSSADSLYGDSCSGVITDLGFNASVSQSCLNNGIGDLNGSSVGQLATLGQNGGPTETVLPLSSNIVIGALDNGTNINVGSKTISLCPEVDQRGVESNGSSCSIGSTTTLSSPTLPSPPLNVVANQLGGSADITWSMPASTGGLPIENFLVFEGTSPGQENMTAPVATIVTSNFDSSNTTSQLNSALVSGIPGNGTVYFTVEAENSLGVSVPSQEASLVIEPSTSTTLTASTLTIAAGSPVSLSVSVTSPIGTPFGNITVSSQSGPIIGCVNIPIQGGQGQCSPVFSTSGTYSLSASFYGANFFNSTSQILVLTVGTEYFVAPIPLGTGVACTQNSPCPFDQALSMVSGPAIISMASGSYTSKTVGSDGFPVQIDTTDNESLAIIGAPNTQVIFDGGDQYQIFQISSTSIVSMRNLTITNASVINNNGGGINNSGTLTLDTITVSNNQVTGTGFNQNANGGGLYNTGIVDIYNSTFSGNSDLATKYSGTDGGAIDNLGTINTEMSTFANNQAQFHDFGTSYGAAIVNRAQLTITHSTFSQNTNPGGPAGSFGGSVGGDLVNYGSAYVSASILSDSCVGPIYDSGYNATVPNSGCQLILSSDVVGNSVANMGPLNSNGGLTQTVAPDPEDPAVEMIAPETTTLENGIVQELCPEIDQRGVSSQGSSCSIGSFQAGNFTVPEAPKSLSAIADSGSIELSWSQPTYNGSDPVTTGYQVFGGTSPGEENYSKPLAKTSSTSATISQLTLGIRYYFTVIAYNQIGASNPSNEVAITPLDSALVTITPSNYVAGVNDPVTLTINAGVSTGLISGYATVDDQGSPISSCTNIYVYEGTGSCQATFQEVGTHSLEANLLGQIGIPNSQSQPVFLYVGQELYAAPTPQGYGSTCSSSQPCTLVQALSDSSGNALIELMAGTYSSNNIGSLPFPLTLSTGKSDGLELQAYSGSKVIFDGQSTSTLFNISSSSNVYLNNLTFQNGHTGNSYGGAIKNDGSLTIVNSTFLDNVADGFFYGGGAIGNFGLLQIDHSTFFGNNGSYGGAIYTGGLDVSVIEDSTFVKNSATAYGNDLDGPFQATESGIFNGVNGADVVAVGTIFLDGCNSPIEDLGFNAAPSNNGCISGNTTDVLDKTLGQELGTLSTNGGSTESVLPVSSSVVSKAIPVDTSVNLTSTTYDTNDYPTTIPGPTVYVCPESDQRGYNSGTLSCNIGSDTLGQSSQSVPVPPSPPVDITPMLSGDNVTLSWSPPSSQSGVSITGYQVFEATSPGGEIYSDPVGHTNSTSIVVENLSPGMVEYFTVEALSASGHSLPSQEVQVEASTASSISLSVPVSKVAQGGLLNISATVVSNLGNPIGTVSFSLNNSPISSCQNLSVVQNTAICPLYTSTSGQFSVTAEFTGQAPYGAGVSNSVSFEVVSTTVTTLVQSTSNKDEIDFQVSSSSGTPTGHITLFIGNSQVVGCENISLVNGAGSCVPSSLTSGHYEVFASYGGATGFLSSQSQPLSVTVNPTITTVSSSSNIVNYGSPVTLIAQVSPSTDIGIGNIEFDANGGLITNCESVPINNTSASCTYIPSAPGSQQVMAKFSGSSLGASSQSMTESFTVALVVAPAPNGAGDVCSITSPCTLQKVTANLSTGDVVAMVSGTYNNISSAGAIPLSINSSQALTVTFEPAGNGPVVLDGSGISQVINIGSNATVNLIDLTIRDGEVHGLGGGITNAGTANLTNVTISSNVANSGGNVFSISSGQGGGVFNSGTLSMNDSAVVNNTVTSNVGISGVQTVLAPGSGAGIYNSGTMTISNSTIAGNDASDYALFQINVYGSGGGIANSGTLEIFNSTIYENVAHTGEGIASSGTADIAGSLLGDGCSGLVQDFGYNATVPGTFCTNGATGDVTNASVTADLSTLTTTVSPYFEPTTGNPVIGAIPNGATISINAVLINICPITDQIDTQSNAKTCSIGSIQPLGSSSLHGRDIQGLSDEHLSRIATKENFQ